MDTTRTEGVIKSFMPAAGGGKQLRLISVPCSRGSEASEHTGDHKEKDEAMTAGYDFVPPLSVEDEDFLSDLIPSPPLDELEDMVYDMGADHFIHHEEVFETETKPITTSTCTEKVAKAAPVDGTFVRHANEKDVISVRGFGKSRPGSLKFR